MVLIYATNVDRDRNMLRIINTGKSLPDNYLVDPNDFFEPGMIGSFTGKRNKMNICGRSRGSYPVGVIDDVRNKLDDSTQASGRITIWNSDIEAETDIFEPDTYSENQLLFVSSQGKFCSVYKKAFKAAQGVANVIKVPNKLNPFLHFKWRIQTIDTKWRPLNKFPHEWDGWVIKDEEE